MELQRVDAHADVKAYLEQGLDTYDWLGNELSDNLPGRAAEANALPLDVIGIGTAFRRELERS